MYLNIANQSTWRTIWYYCFLKKSTLLAVKWKLHKSLTNHNMFTSEVSLFLLRKTHPVWALRNWVCQTPRWNMGWQCWSVKKEQTCQRDPRNITFQICWGITNKWIAESKNGWGEEGLSAPPCPAQSRINYCMLPRTLSSWVLNMPKDGDSAASVGSLF